MQCLVARSYSIMAIVRACYDINVLDTKVPCAKLSHLQKVSTNKIVSGSARCLLSFCGKQCYPQDNSKIVPLYLHRVLIRKQFSLGPFFKMPGLIDWSESNMTRCSVLCQQRNQWWGGVPEVCHSYRALSIVD